MEIITAVSLLLGSIMIGIITRIITRNKPKAALLIWLFLMVVLLSFLVYGIILIIKQETSLFTRSHISNELIVIGSFILIIDGFLYFRRNKKNMIKDK